MEATLPGIYALVSPTQIEDGPRPLSPIFGLVFLAIKTRVRVVFVDQTGSTHVEAYQRYFSSSNDWHYFMKSLEDIPFIREAWESSSKVRWQIVVLFEVETDGRAKLDNLG